MTQKTRLALVAAVALLPALARAQTVPPYLTDQGRLSDNSGNPEVGSLAMTYSLYSVATGGTALWTESQTVTFTNGYYAATLGSTTPLTPSLFSGQNLWLGIKVSTDPEMTPRSQIASVPYAFTSQNAIGDITPHSVSVGGTTVINAAGNVGIGTASPAFSLDIGGKTDAVALPAGSTAQRPTGADGALRFNTDFGNYELFSHGFWFRQEPLLLSDSARTKVTFGYTGADQTWVVPAGVTHLYAKAWGAGGAGGSEVWSYGAEGGGGGHARGLIPVTAGESLRLIVGQGGIAAMSAGYTYGGGASATFDNVDNRWGGSGGGMSGIFRGTSPLLIAGGGGGGGCSRYWTGNQGGAGGGLTGQGGESPYDWPYGGQPGTQSGGGAATPTGTCGNGQAGVQYQGGHAACHSYGGGGGGGYFGGGGGGYVEPNTMGGGGGGSGYLDASVLSGVLLAGHAREPALNSDSDLPQIISNNTLPAHGGSINVGGAAGFVVVYY